MSDDLMFQDQIRETVRSSYRDIPSGAGRAAADRFYAPEELASVPEPAIDWALGVGNPVRHAGLREGEVVLDIGAGGGIDTVLAARQVGPTGRVIGLDTLPEMCDRARAAVREAGTDAWCELVEGEMEAIPLPDASVDVVVSNGVINLSPRKSRAIAEIARVLRPGGRLCVSDLTVDDELPPEVLSSDAAWAGCIAGALSERVFARKLERAGLVDIEFSERSPFGIDDVAVYPLFTPEVLDLMRQLIPEPAQQRVAVGLIARAAKPDASPNGEVRAAGEAGTRVERLTDIAPTEVAEAPGVTVRHLKRVEDVDLKVLDVEPRGSTPYHTHEQAHEGVVVSGEGALRLANGREPLRPGDVFHVRPNERHAIESTGHEPLRFVCMDCFVD